MNNCSCGNKVAYAACCQPIINDIRPAETAEQLMRARYSAYAMTEMDFVFASTHPDHRHNYDHEGTRTWAEKSDWLGLQILSTSKGGKDDTEGQVEFIASFREKGATTPSAHHENSNFIKEDGYWYFMEGEIVKNRPFVSTKTGRNEPCICGSGNKYKKCCGK